jgi:hypothetical protein
MDCRVDGSRPHGKAFIGRRKNREIFWRAFTDLGYSNDAHLAIANWLFEPLRAGNPDFWKAAVHKGMKQSEQTIVRAPLNPRFLSTAIGPDCVKTAH